MSETKLPDTSCKEAYDLLFDYMEGGLPSTTQAALRAHFAVCPPCGEFVASYRRTPPFARAALKVEVPPEVTEQVQAFIRKKLSGK